MPAFWEYHPLPHYYSYYLFTFHPKSKQHKGKVINLKNCLKCKIWNVAKSFTFNTPSEVAWYDIWIWNGSSKYWWRYRADMTPSTDGWTDGQTDRWTVRWKDDICETSTSPFNLVEAGDIMIIGYLYHYSLLFCMIAVWLPVHCNLPMESFSYSRLITYNGEKP